MKRREHEDEDERAEDGEPEDDGAAEDEPGDEGPGDEAMAEERVAAARRARRERGRERRSRKRWRRPRVPPGERGPAAALGVAMVFSAFLILFETRGTTFFNDEFILFQRFEGDFSFETILMPFNGHLIALGSLIFEGGLNLFGPETLFFKLVGIASLWGLAALLYAYLRRLLPVWLAVVPALIILFLGSSWEVLLWPMSNINTCLSLGAGLAALMAVERERGRGDVVACVLLAIGLLAGTYAIAFLVGAAVSIAAHPHRLGRAWVVLVPLTLYAAWWIWAQSFDQGGSVELVNAWLIPSFSLDSLAVVLAAMSGLAASLTGQGSNPTIAIEEGWGQVLAVAALVGLGWRLTRGRMPPGFWPAVAALLTYWALISLGFGVTRTPDESRYILPGVVLFALVAGNALSGVRLPRPAAIAVAAVTVVAITTGIRQLHDGGLFLRNYSERAQATLAGLEAAPNPDPRYVPRFDPAIADIVPSQLTITAGPYLEAAREFGSPGFSAKELRKENEFVQAIADRVRVAVIADEAGVEPPAP